MLSCISMGLANTNPGPLRRSHSHVQGAIPYNRVFNGLMKPEKLFTIEQVQSPSCNHEKGQEKGNLIRARRLHNVVKTGRQIMPQQRHLAG